MTITLSLPRNRPGKGFTNFLKCFKVGLYGDMGSQFFPHCEGYHSMAIKNTYPPRVSS